MNYAWANPIDGTREQAATPSEARARAWEELQRTDKPEYVLVYLQEPAGWASKNAAELASGPDAEGMTGYAWADPATGVRKTAELCDWNVVVLDIEMNWPADAPIDRVTIYRHQLAFEVWRIDQRPEPGPLIEIPDDSPASLVEQVMSGTCADMQRASMLAALWTAGSLQEIAGALHGPPRFRTKRRLLDKSRMRRNPSRRRPVTLWSLLREMWRSWKFPIQVEWEGHAVFAQTPKDAAELVDAIIAMENPAKEYHPDVPETSPPAGEQDSVTAEQYRARLVRERDSENVMPHGYVPGKFLDVCHACQFPEKHAIHGYTGE